MVCCESPVAFYGSSMDMDGPSPLHGALDVGHRCRTRESTSPVPKEERSQGTKEGKLKDVKVIHRSQTADVLVVPNFLSTRQSQELVRVAEHKIGFECCTSLGSAGGEAYRRHGRIQVWDEKFARRLWEETGLDKMMHDVRIDGRQPVGLHPKIRIYRYQVGERFGKHVDDYEELGDGKRTQYTLLIYLTGGIENRQAGNNSSKDVTAKCAKHPTTSKGKRKGVNAASNKVELGKDVLVGGETVFYNSKGKVLASVSPTCGMALLHLHGEHCLEHEAKPVLQGLKYILRSDVVFQ